MTAPITRISPDFALLKRTEFDNIIDVRSPSEFLDDHIPGAINLPVLDDAQRAKIGTIYKQIDPFEAKRSGGRWWRKILLVIFKLILPKKIVIGAPLSIAGVEVSEAALWQRYLVISVGIAP